MPFSSKTDLPCDCDYLESMSKDSDMPIKFDSRMNEYSIAYTVDGMDGLLLIRHCPSCGGKTPKSRRGSMFATIPTIEHIRLVDLTKSRA